MTPVASRALHGTPFPRRPLRTTRRKRSAGVVFSFAVVAAPALLLGTLRLDPPERTDAVVLEGSTSARPLAARRELSLVTYNVWGLPAWLSPAPEARYALVADALSALEPDVVALQEVWCDAALRAVPGGAEWSVVRGRRERRLGSQNGLVTATRHRVLEAASFHFRHEAGPGALVNGKGALFAAIELPDGRVGHVWNTHLHAQLADERIRVLQVEELIGWMADALRAWRERADGREPFVCVLGDLNCVPGSAPFRRLVAWLERSGTVAASTGLAPTYDGTLDAWATDEEPRAIDHGLVAGPPVRGFRADRVLAAPHPALGGRHLSDHLGARIRFAWAP